MSSSIDDDPLTIHAVSMGQLFAIMLRRWWVVLLIPIIAISVTWLLQRTEPYQSVVRATVLIPGDTEIPGNSERPELMVLDDLSPFIRSYAFANLVYDAISDDTLSVQQIRSMLEGSRYSRILTVRISGDDADEVATVARAVEAAIPTAIDAYLVPESESATVRIIDPPSDPTRDRDDHLLQLLITGALGLLVGASIAVGLGSRDPDPQALAEAK